MKPYFTQGKCLIPVVTLVLYYSQKNWSGPRSLHEMMVMPVVKKYQRGLAVEIIAEQVEEAVSVLEAICNVIRECGSGINSEEIYSRLNQKV